MKYCPKCHSSLVEDAKFCHKCGSNTADALVACNSCTKLNPSSASICYGCAVPLNAIVVVDNAHQSASKFDYIDRARFEVQIMNLFFEDLKKITHWQKADAGLDFLQAFHFSEFKTTVQRRTQQLAESFQEIFFAADGTPSTVLQEQALENAVYHLALQFCISQGTALSDLEIPNRVLLHEKAHILSLNRGNMLEDFFYLEAEKPDMQKRFYTDFVKMPEEKLKNALKNYLYAAKGEKIWLVSDQSIWGSAEQGFAISEFGIYWKNRFRKPEKVYFHQLARLEMNGDYLSINNRYFNVTPQLNLKILLFLEKTRLIYGV
jgi:hypothetical protein